MTWTEADNRKLLLAFVEFLEGLDYRISGSEPEGWQALIDEFLSRK